MSRGQGKWYKFGSGVYHYVRGTTLLLAVVRKSSTGGTHPWASYIRGRYAGVSRTLKAAKWHCQNMLSGRLTV